MNQRELLPVEHRSLQPKRLRSPKGSRHGINHEAIWASEWRKINKEIPCLLGLLLAKDDSPRDWAGQTMPVHVTRRDAAVAATIIQWLGTNVGNGFVDRCQRLVKVALELHLRRAAMNRHRDSRTQLQRDKAKLDKVRQRLKKAVE